jgi:extracellular elastinolytic metalloproteinase
MRRKLPVALNALLVSSLLFVCQAAFCQQDYKSQALELIKANASKEGLSEDDLQNMAVGNAYYNNLSGTIMAYVQQTYKGIAVYNGIQVFAFKNGQVVSQSGQRIKKMANKVTATDGVPVLSSSDALRTAANHINKTITQFITPLDVLDNGRKMVFPALDIAQGNITVELLWVPSDSGRVKLGWQVQIAPKGSIDHWLIRVDALNSKILGKDNFTVSCNFESKHNHADDCLEVTNFAVTEAVQNVQAIKSVNTISAATYRVSPFPAESPIHAGGALALKTDPWLLASTGNNATTLKWHNDGTADYPNTRGNNVYAQEDRDGSNSTVGSTAPSSTPDPSLTFDFPYNPVLPTAYVSQNTAVTNLFYWNNIIHDVTYQYGFDEVSGNFQASNLGRGGLGNDYVMADAQDAGGINNANFNTPNDGGRPTMQMYLWNSRPNGAMYINSPSSFIGYKYAVESNFVTNIPGNTLPSNKLSRRGPVTGDIVLYNDSDVPTNHYACVNPLNAAQLFGKIALIDRGGPSCTFSERVKKAQTAGAIAVIVVNNVSGTPTTMGGDYDASVTIPALMISTEDGVIIKGLLSSSQTVNTTLAPFDGDMDNGIIVHEYGHGISNRLTGGPANSGCLQNAEQMGEGWSDYLALMITTNWATATINDGSLGRGIGNYVVGQVSTGNGIRTYKYSTNMSTNPWTYAMLATNTGGESHTVGEIWCTALWHMTWNIIQQDNLINTNFYNANALGGNSAAMKLVLMGMKLQPCSPGFLDGRNAILKADTLLFNGKYSCAIWNAFAQRGMGAFATQGSSASYTDQVADYSIPQKATISKTVDKPIAAMNEELTYSLRVEAQCSPISSYKLVDTLAANITYVAGSGGVYNSANRTVTFSPIDLSTSQKQVFTFKAKVNLGTYSAAVQHINETVTSSSLPSAWASSSSTSTQWTVSSSQSYSAPYSFFALELATPSLQTLTTTGSYNLTRVSTLSFYHNYNTESGFDGGVVEISTDNGISWIDLGPYIKVNGYNSRIASDAGTVLDGRSAFSGISGGFVQTIINLAEFAGSTAKFRFRFVSDNGTAITGWFVDNINVRSESGVFNKAQLYDNLNSYLGSSDTTSIIMNAVPVQWGSFTAEKKATNSLLKWITVQEQNSLKFMVERSIDGRGFVEIGTVKASGNTNAETAYTFTDVLPVAGINYYRIKQIDMDGRAVYSDVRTVTFNPFNGSIYVTPNPAKDRIAITVPGNNKLLQVVILNAVGQKVQTANISGQYNQIMLNNLPAGLYYIRISGEEGEQTKKLFIQ